MRGWEEEGPGGGQRVQGRATKGGMGSRVVG